MCSTPFKDFNRFLVRLHNDYSEIANMHVHEEKISFFRIDNL